MVQNPIDYNRESRPAFRVQKLTVILAQHYEFTDPAASLRDLLADARHFADANGLAYADEDHVAYDHYSAERMEHGPLTIPYSPPQPDDKSNPRNIYLTTALNFFLATGSGFWSELEMTCQKFAVRHENATWWRDDERFCPAEDDFGHKADEHDHGAARHE